MVEGVKSVTLLLRRRPLLGCQRPFPLLGTRRLTHQFDQLRIHFGSTSMNLSHKFLEDRSDQLVIPGPPSTSEHGPVNERHVFGRPVMKSPPSPPCGAFASPVFLAVGFREHQQNL